MLCIAIITLVPPLVRGWLFMKDMKRRANETFGGRQQRGRTRRDDDEYTETGERKIYGSTEGEYAEYEEVIGTIIEETASTSETQVTVEEQISDAEYEDI